MRSVLKITTLFFLITACGSLKKSDSKPSFTVENDLSQKYLDPESKPFIAPGSKLVLSSPNPGPMAGPTLIRLYAEEGAKIYFDLREFEDLEDAQEYKEPVLLTPPFKIWAVSVVDGVKGEILEFEYRIDESKFYSSFTSKDNRLLEIQPEMQSISVQTLNLKSLDEKNPWTKAFQLDGRCDEWGNGSSLVQSDPAGDIPAILNHVDVTRAGIFQEGDFSYLMIETLAPVEQKSQIAYGFSVGPSEITSQSFGNGTNFVYQVEIQNEDFSIYKDKSEKAETLSDESAAKLDECFEAKIHKSNLTALSGQNSIAFRPYAVDWRKGLTVRDKLLPLYQNSSFRVLNYVFDSENRSNTVNFFVDNAYETESFIDTHLYFSSKFIPALSSLNGLPFFELSTYPFYYTKEEEAGYAGLNATDRGLLTTWGKNKSFTGAGQLVAHEFAHYQNAAYSKVDQQWMQEGMSEWSAERAMYHAMPARAVYETFVNRRIKPFISYLDSNDGESNYLETWDTYQKKNKTPLPLGYERAYTFFTLLDHEVGSRLIAEAFQYGFGMGMNSASFQKFLERKTGRDLSEIFQYYVNAGPVVPEYDPSVLFVDDDADGILNIDETFLGSDKARVDSDNDGYFDGEEFFQGTDPTVSKVEEELNQFGPTYAAVTSQHDNFPSAFWRAGTGVGETIAYSGISDDVAEFRAYTGPVSAYPPFHLYGELRSDAPLLVKNSNGTFSEAIITDLADEPDGIVPAVPLVSSLSLNFEQGTLDPSLNGTSFPAQDFEYDLPEIYGSYDIKSFLTYLDSDSNLIIKLETRNAPDASGAWGKYTFDLSDLNLINGAFTENIWGNLNIINGETLWVPFSGPDVDDIEKISVTFGSSIEVKIPNEYITDWLENSTDEEKIVCASTKVELTKTRFLEDKISCVPVVTNTRRMATTFTDSLGISTHTVELYVDTDEATISNSDAQDYLEFISRAIHVQSSLLQRPIDHRHHWAFYISEHPSISRNKTDLYRGIYLRFLTADTLQQRQYALAWYIAETTLRERRDAQGLEIFPGAIAGVPANFFIYDVIRQWLINKTLFLTEPTAGFSPGYSSWVAAGQAQVPRLADYLSEVGAPSRWAKIAAFLNELEDYNSSDAIAEVMGTFYNFYPETALEFKELLKVKGVTRYYDTDSTQEENDIEGLYKKWIDD